MRVMRPDHRAMLRLALSRASAALAIVVVTASALAAATPASAQGNGWLQPIQVSQTGRFSWFPDLATDGSGRVHVAWSSGEDGFDTVMYLTNPGDGTPASRQPVNVVAVQQPGRGESAATRPGILVDQQGILQMTYTDYLQIYLTQAFQETAARPQAWTDPKTVNFETSTYFSRMAMDAEGRLHLVFTQNVLTPECQRCFHLYHRYSDDSGRSWSMPQDISSLETGSAKPQVIADRDGNVHAVWESGFGGTLGTVSEPTQVLYAASYDRGQTWSRPLAFTSGAPDSIGRMPAIAQDGEGKLVAVWRSKPEEVVYYQVSRDAGQSWSAPQRIPRAFTSNPVAAGDLDSYSLASDAAGNVHLAMVGRMDADTANLSVMHLVWNGSSWSDPVPITTYENGDVPEWPRIAVSLGNQLHVAWFTRNRANVFSNDAAGADYRVWYARSATDAPASPPRAYPTPMPTAMPTALPDVRPVEPTAIAVSAAVPIVTNAALATEMDDLGMVALSALPVLALVALGLVLLWRGKQR